MPIEQIKPLNLEGIPEKDKWQAVTDWSARLARSHNYVIENLDSDNVKRIFTDRTDFGSSDGRLSIDGPKLSMYGNSTTVERLALGYSTVAGSSDFRFSLKNLAGVETVGIDSSGDAKFKGLIQAGSVIVSEDSTTVLADVADALEAAAAAQATADNKNITLRSDGAPYTATFTRATAAYKQDGTSVSSGAVRYETAATGFGQAATVEEGATNLIPSSFGLMTVDGNADGIVDGFAKIDYNATCVYALDGGQKITLANVTNANGYGQVSLSSWAAVAPNTVYVFSVDAALTRSTAETIRLYIVWYTAGDVYITESSVFNINPGTSYSRQQLVGTSPATAAKAAVVGMLHASAIGDTGNAHFRHAMFEQRAYATSFHETTRNAETLTMLKAGVFSDSEGSIQRRIYSFRTPGTNHQFIFDGGGATNKNLQVYIASATGKVTLVYGTGSAEKTITSSGAAVASGTWYDIGCKWSPAGVTLYQAGASVGTDTTAPGLVLGDTFYLGSKADGSLQLDGLLDDFRGSLHARTDADFLADYTAGVPLTYDKWARLKMAFDNDLAVTAGAIGDAWLDSDNGNKVSRWTGTSWLANAFGPGALAVTQLSAITADMGDITAGHITASTFDSGYINASTINAAQINASSFASGHITASTIVAGTIIGSTIMTDTTGHRLVLTGNQLRSLNNDVLDGYALNGDDGSIYLYTDTGGVAGKITRSTAGGIDINASTVLGGGKPLNLNGIRIDLGLPGSNTTTYVVGAAHFVSDTGVHMVFDHDRIAFFSSAMAAQQTVANLSSTGTLAETINKLNAGLTALRNYGLLSV